MPRPFFLVLSTLAVVGGFIATGVRAGGDWPQFRYDAGRTAAAPHSLAADLELRWTRTLEEPRPAFPHEVRLLFDASYEPVVLGSTMFVPSMVNDSVTALDTETGESRWRFFAEGPVRFAPVAADGKVYFVSDDGHLYCLDASDGSLLWTFRGLPEQRQDRRIIGDGRLVSLWAARGGPVLADGVVYFAAGFWPAHGVFIHAVDAQSGQAVWSNTTSHHIPESNWDHAIGQDGGLMPLGYLAIVADMLVVPCGAQLPAFLDLETGDLVPTGHNSPRTGDPVKYTMGWGGRNGHAKGTWFVAGTGKYLSHGGDLYDITRTNDERFFPDDPATYRLDYKPLMYPGGWTRLRVDPANQKPLGPFMQPVLTPETMYKRYQDTIVARDLTTITVKERDEVEVPPYRRNDFHADNLVAIFEDRWQRPSELQVHIKAGRHLYVGGPGTVQAIDTGGDAGEVVWQAEIEGTPQRMLAADGKLFVVTREGSIFAFAAPHDGEIVRHGLPEAPAAEPDRWTEKAAATLAATGVHDGYALVLGLENGRLVEELARQSELHVIAVAVDADKAAAVRERLYRAGLYGTRASVLVGDPVSYPLPPFVASLIVSENPDGLKPDDQTLVHRVLRALRPYGGVACLWDGPEAGARLERMLDEQDREDEMLAGAEVRQSDDVALLVRSGSLPGAGDFSHQQANAANTGATEDQFIRSPLAVLWFDGSHRWHRRPGSLELRIAGGRMIMLEAGELVAIDVYTGRQLWQTELSVGEETLDDPQARRAARRTPAPWQGLPPSTELVALHDAIYISDGTRCLVFDADTGQLSGSINLPDELEEPWSNLRVWDDYLVGVSSGHVVCFDRRTGDLLWRFACERDALSLAVADGRVFLGELADMRRGEDEQRDGTTRALDVATGKILWEKAGGARLRYSSDFDLLVTPGGFYNGADGALLARLGQTPDTRFVVEGRDRPEGGLPGFIAGDKLLTGTDDELHIHAIPSGQPVGDALTWVRRGCTAPRASTHLFTTRYRSNSAWIDLASREITPFWGMRPGCTINNNLFPANGVLSIPNLTGGCVCNFTNASVACVPAALVENSSEE